MKRTGKIKRRLPLQTRRRDTPDSLEIRRRYRDENTSCEVTRWLYSQPSLVHLIQVQWGTPELDHLWGGTGGRLDLWGMMLVVDAWWHRWKTANFTAGLLLFLVVKNSKGEINADEFKKCSGYNLAGWLQLDKTIDACPDWLEEYRMELLEDLLA